MEPRASLAAEPARAPLEFDLAGALSLSLVACVSYAPLVLQGSGADALGDLSRLALAAWPWIALLGLPRKARPRGASAWRPAFGATAIALPAIALGASFDHARGGEPRELLVLAFVAALCAGLLAWAAERASRSERSRRAHALAWFVLVPLGPALAGALALGGAPLYGDAPAAIALLARASPLGWLMQHAVAAPGAAGRGAGALVLELAPVLGAVLLVLAASAWPSASGRAPGSTPGNAPGSGGEGDLERSAKQDRESERGRPAEPHA